MKVIFWHICQLNNWLNVVNDQMNIINRSGLYDEVDRINICLLGDNEQALSSLVNSYSKIQIVYYSPDVSEFERPCLHYMLEWSKHLENKTTVLYIHTKGVTRPNYPGLPMNDNVWSWRKMMEFFLIENYKECLKYIDNNYDVVGCNLINSGNQLKISEENHCLHFSGNFWWSHSDYIRKLPKIRNDILDLKKDNAYWLCERWILQPHPNARLLEIYSHSNKKAYYSKIDRSDYIKFFENH